MGVEFNESPYNDFRNWCLNCPFVIPFSGLCITSQNPTRVEWDDMGRLHCEDGMAVEYKDGWGLWSFNGVSVDEQIVMSPETQSIEQIRGEKNEEVKRIRIERYGWTRYLSAVNASRVHSRRNDIEGTQEFLYSTDENKVLLCACPSTAKEFALEVPPSVETCEQAQSYLSSGLSGRIISAS